MSARYTVVQCDECGGAVAFDAEREHTRCRFCAAVALTPVLLDAPPQRPADVLPFAIDGAAAHAAFVAWAAASWWRPRALRDALAELEPVWIPTWRLRAEVEVHWAALVDAPTRSGKRPRTGIDRGPAELLIPASAGLQPEELAALRPFAAATRAWHADDADVPCELPSLSEAAALAAAPDLFATERLRVLAGGSRLHDAGGTARLHELRTSFEALPVWVGSYRYRDRPWRVVVNGSTAKVVGAAPLDRLKVTLAVLVVLAIALLFARCERREPEPTAQPTHAGSAASHGTTAST